MRDVDASGGARRGRNLSLLWFPATLERIW